MRKILYLIICLPLLLLAACDVHEWPEGSLPPDTQEPTRIYLRLNYETDMTEWEHLYLGTSVTEQALGETYDNRQEYGKIRYIIRTYPVTEGNRMQDHVQEFVFTKNIAEGYDYEAALDVQPGNYDIMVWSDLVKSKDDEHFYNAYDFSEIMLQGDHQGNNDHRDAFYGKIDSVSLESNNGNLIPDTIDITMKRPLAKFEIIANDFSEFMESMPYSIDNQNAENYKVRVQYAGFMPSAYSLFTNKPVDSSTGVIFESSLNRLSDKDASIGFDYVFTSESESSVTIRIGVYDSKGTQVSLTETIKVPLRTNHHIVLTGNFLMQNASGGIDINPGFDGNYNIVIP